MHRLTLTYFADLNIPTQFGFAQNQVTPFFLPTTPRIFAWHILPLGAYSQHREALTSDTPLTTLSLLQSNPDARLLIHFHGNAGTVGAAYRPAYLRSLSAADPKNIHILAVEYRGFGLSEGSPDEEGLIEDGIAAVRWALDAGIPAERITLLGQSLGTAVTFGVAEKLVREEGIELGAIISIAGFADMRSLVATYRVAGMIPILSPLKSYPIVQRYLASYVRDTWNSAARIESLVRLSKKLRLVIIHASNDQEIPSANSHVLFTAAVNGTREEGYGWKEILERKTVREFGDESKRIGWETGDERRIEQWVVKWGGHNKVVTSSGTSIIVADAMGLVR